MWKHFLDQNIYRVRQFVAWFKILGVHTLHYCRSPDAPRKEEAPLKQLALSMQNQNANYSNKKKKKTMLTISKVYLLANIVQKFCKPCRFFQNSYESSWRVIWFYIGFFCYESIITLLEFEDRKEALHAWNNGLLKPQDHLQDLYANFYFTRCSNTFIPSSQLPLFKKSVQCNLSEEPI